MSSNARTPAVPARSTRGLPSLNARRLQTRPDADAISSPTTNSHQSDSRRQRGSINNDALAATARQQPTPTSA
jgi:hypothetical protein